MGRKVGKPIWGNTCDGLRLRYWLGSVKEAVGKQVEWGWGGCGGCGLNFGILFYVP